MLSAMYNFLNLSIVWHQFYPIYKMGKMKDKSIFESSKKVFSILGSITLALLEFK